MSREYTRQLVLTATTIELNGVSQGTSYSIPAAEYAEWYVITGTATMNNGLTITSSGSPATNSVVKILYSAVMDFNTEALTIMGYTIPAAYEDKEFTLIANYNGATWDVYFNPDLAQTEVVTNANLIDASITVGKMANLARGSILVGDVTNRPAAVDAKTVNYLLVGDGNDLASVESTGDVIIDDTGTATIQANAVENTMINAGTRGDIKVAGAAGAWENVNIVGTAQLIIGQGAGATPAAAAMSGDATMTIGGVVTIAAEAVTLGKMADLARGSIITGQTAGNRPTALDAKTNAQILIGDGNDLISVPVTGDISIDNAGLTAIQTDSVSNLMLEAAAQGDVKVGGAAGVYTDVSIATSGDIIIGQGAGVTPAAFNLNGDVRMTNVGLTTIQPGAVDPGMLSTTVATEVVSAIISATGAAHYVPIRIPYDCTVDSSGTNIQFVCVEAVGGVNMDMNIADHLGNDMIAADVTLANPSIPGANASGQATVFLTISAGENIRVKRTSGAGTGTVQVNIPIIRA